MNTNQYQRFVCLGLAILLAFTLNAMPAQARVIFADAAADPTTADGTRAHPFPRIQQAIDSAASGDTVRAAPGTYYEQIRLVDGVRVYGGAVDPVLGWPSTIINGYDRHAAGTLVTAEGVNGAHLEGVAIVAGRASQAGGMLIRDSHVTVHRCSFYHNTCDDTGNGGGMVIQGNGEEGEITVVSECDFTQNSTPDGNGGAISIRDATPEIRDCLLRGNEAENGTGGAIHVENASPTVTGCRFLIYTVVIDGEVLEFPNRAKDGGAIGTDNSSPTVLDCQFEGNRATAIGVIGGRGGGICHFGASTPTVRECRFIGNHARRGGGIWTSIATATVSECVFESNHASTFEAGGGICHDHELFEGLHDGTPSTPRIVNCTFWRNRGGTGGGMAAKGAGASSQVINCTFYGNEATGWHFGRSGSGGIGCLGGTNMVVRNCILWENVGETDHEQIKIEGSAPIITFCSIQGGFAGATNGEWEPAFRDPDGGDFHLDEDSACIDAGDPDETDLPLTDFEGDTRVIDDRVEVGIDEWHATYMEMFWELEWGRSRIHFVIRWPYELRPGE